MFTRQRSAGPLCRLALILVLTLTIVHAGVAGVLSLGGLTGHAAAADSASLDLGIGAGEDFTIEAFFYAPALTKTGTASLIYKPDAYDLYVLFNASGQHRLLFRLYTGIGSTVFIYYDTSLSVGWHHIAAVFDNENTPGHDVMFLYLDGMLVASGGGVDWNPGLPNTSRALYVGGYFGNSAYQVDEVRLSNSVRYSGPSYTVPTASFSNDANTRALWHFDEAVGSTIFADASGNGNSLTGVDGASAGEGNSVTSLNSVDCFFNWAERTYSQVFAPAGASSNTGGPYYYRCYSQTGACLGSSSADNHIYYVGPLSNNALFDLGALSTWLATATCQ